MSFLKSIFWNADEERVRSLWRLVIQFVLTFIAFLLASIISLPVGDANLRRLVREIATVILMLGLVFMLSQILDRRQFKDYGYSFDKNWVADFSFGFLLGVFIFVFVFMVEMAAGYAEIETYFYKYDPMPFALQFLISFSIYVSIGIVEETFSRGYQLKNFLEGLSFKKLNPKISLALGLGIVSLIFGFLHGGNPNASLVSSINISVIALLFGYAYLIRGSLAVPIGLHISWNFTQGNLFGYPVSGVATDISIIKVKVTGNEFITGGDFGPEAGAVIFLALLFGMALTYAYHKKRYNSANIDFTLLSYSKENSTCL